MKLYNKDSYCWVPYTRKYSYTDFGRNTAPTKWIARRGVVPYWTNTPYFYYKTGVAAANAKDYFCSDKFDRVYRFTVSYKNEKNTFYVTRHFLYNDKYELICILLRNRYKNDILGDMFMLLIRDDACDTKPVQAIIHEFKKYSNVDICITNIFSYSLCCF